VDGAHGDAMRRIAGATAKNAAIRANGMNLWWVGSSDVRLPGKDRTSMFRSSMRKPLTLCLAAALFAAPALTPSAQAAGPQALKKVALVDLERCILETAQGKAATKELEKALARSNAKLERKAKEVQQQFEDLQAKAAMLAQAEAMRRQQELMRQQQELEQLYQETQVKLAEREQQLTEKIYRNVAAIVKTIAEQEDVQIVLVRAAANVIYAAPRLDITNRVIVAYDKKHK
jgi:outer membrane protein